MALTKEDRTETIENFRINDKDVGSAEVQIALLSGKIDYLSKHLQQHKKDFHSRRGLIRAVNRRRKLLDYLKGKEFAKYKEMIEKLGLRK